MADSIRQQGSSTVGQCTTLCTGIKLAYCFWCSPCKMHNVQTRWFLRETGIFLVAVVLYITNRSLLAEMFAGVTVEGVVSGFVRTDNDRGFFNSAEFAVGGVPFRVTYRHGGAKEVLALPEWSGGPLRDGLYVRVRHHNGKVLRVEVREL
jgi:hypothetical protein